MRHRGKAIAFKFLTYSYVWFNYFTPPLSPEGARAPVEGRNTWLTSHLARNPKVLTYSIPLRSSCFNKNIIVSSFLRHTLIFPDDFWTFTEFATFMLLQWWETIQILLKPIRDDYFLCISLVGNSSSERVLNIDYYLFIYDDDCKSILLCYKSMFKTKQNFSVRKTNQSIGLSETFLNN